MKRAPWIVVRVAGSFVKTYDAPDEETADIIARHAAKKYRADVVTIYGVDAAGRRTAGRRVVAPPRLRLVRTRENVVVDVADFDAADDAADAALRAAEDHPGCVVALYALSDGDLLLIETRSA